WSPDGKYLAFLSSRQGAKGAQIWLMNRAGGEAVKLTEVKGGISDYAWSPDSKRFILVVQDPDPGDPDPDAEKKEGEPKTPKPIVIDRYYFKADGSGYLRGERADPQPSDNRKMKAEPGAPGAVDEEPPPGPPDGTPNAFIRRHGDGHVDKT